MVQYLRNKAVILTAMLFLIIFGSAHVQAEPTVTPGGLLKFAGQIGSQFDFDAAFPDLPVEDFEESGVADDSFLFFTSPLDSATNQPPAFVPGDISDGLIIQPLNTPGIDDMGVMGGSYLYGNTSKAVYMPFPATKELAIVFTGDGVNAVGMDLFFLLTADTATIKIYGSGNTLLDTIWQPVALTATFFGIYSTQPITKITVENFARHEVVDNIRFGAVASLLTLYTDQTVFEAAHPGLPMEDFEESPVAPGALEVFPEPLDNMTDVPGAFVPGDILDDIHMRTVPIPMSPPSDLLVAGDNYAGSMGNDSNIVCSTTTTVDDLQISFINATATEYEIDSYAVGLDLLQFAQSNSPPQNAILSVYDVFDRLLGATTIQVLAGEANFIGVSSNVPIFKINFQFVNPLHECIDNIRYGGSVQGLTFYTTETDFKKARTNLPCEDFSESPVADNTTIACNEPIDSTTNQPGCFVPGDILPNISFQTEDSLNAACPACMDIHGPNSGPMGNATPLLAVNSPDRLEIAFSGNRVHYVGISQYGRAVISLYDASDILLGTTHNWMISTTDQGFRGIESSEPISRITIEPDSWLNEITFGPKFPWSSYLPAINSGAGSPGP